MKILLLIGLAWAAPVQNLKVDGVKPLSLEKGKKGEVVVSLSVKKGFHVQANPASRPQLIATKVDVIPSAGIEVGQAAYPASKEYKVGGLDFAVATFDGAFDVKVPVSAGASAKPGKVSLEGRVKYQACDDKVCFPPTMAKFSVPVEIH